MLIVAVNEIGRRIGESHPRAKLSDAIVDWIRDLHEEKHFSYTKIKILLYNKGIHVSRSCIAAICRYERRCQFASRFKELKKVCPWPRKKRRKK